jgi:hypothetical protein
MAALERVVIDVGRKKRKAIRELKEGIGPIAEEVHEAAQAAAKERSSGAKEVVPVVILYRKRGRKPRGILGAILGGL